MAQRLSSPTSIPSASVASIPVVPEQILAEWRKWGLASKPDTILSIKGGLTNQNYLIVSGGVELLLRLNNTAKSLGIYRDEELAIHQHMAKAGLTPAVRYHSSELNYWVRDFILGTPLAAAPSSEDLRAVTEVLSTVHAQRPRANLHTLDVQAACAQYLAQCDGHSEAVIRLKEEVSQLVPIPADDACLCHLDPLPANWLRDSEGKLWLLDWEYAALAHPSLDYAALQLQLPENKQALFESFIPENLREVMADARTQVRLMDRSWRLAHTTG